MCFCGSFGAEDKAGSGMPERLEDMRGNKIILATRGSRLALIQTGIVRAGLSSAGFDSEILIVETKGDRDRLSELKKIGGDGLFVRELERAVYEGRADAAVHSAKDLPYELMEKMTIASVPEAADHRDVLVMRASCAHKAGDAAKESSAGSLTEMSKEKEGRYVIGTGSMRRLSELQKLLGDGRLHKIIGVSDNTEIVFKNLRGNIDTRLKKLRSGEYDAIVMAKAGLLRFEADTSGLILKTFSEDEMIPAPCQGILAVECRADDEETINILRGIDNGPARLKFDIERELFMRMGSDCSRAAGACAVIHAPKKDKEGEGTAESVRLMAMLDGRRAERTGGLQEAKALMDGVIGDIYRETGLR